MSCIPSFASFFLSIFTKTIVSFICFVTCVFSSSLGYENTSGEWDEYPQYVHAEGVEVGSPVSKNPLSLLLFVSLFISLNMTSCLF